MRRFFALVAMVTFFAGTTVHAADDLQSPLGLWQTIDDSTGKPRGIVRLYEQNGRYFARIETTLTPGDERRRCTACSDERKDQPFTGLVLMRNMKLENGEYSGGDILDPNTGDIYRCNFKLEHGGKVLVVRGYIGVALFGRTQKWVRAQD